MIENLILGAVLALCIAYMAYRLVRLFKRTTGQAPEECDTCGTCIAAPSCDSMPTSDKDVDTPSKSPNDD